LPCKRPAAVITAAGAGARLAHRSHILLLEGETYRFRKSLEQQAALPAAT